MSDLPNGWCRTTVGEVTCGYETIDPQKQPDTTFSYVDIGSIDNLRQVISSPKTIKGAEAPSRARRVIETGDTLFSTVRTYLKNVAQVPAELDGQLTSTGIAVLRPNSAIIPEFLFTVAKSDAFIDQVSVAQDGTMYPAVSDRDVSEAMISLPPLSEQRRIVTKINSLSGKSKRARDHLDHVPRLVEKYKRAILTAEFANAERVALGEVTDFIQYGYTAKSQSEPVGSQYLRITDIQHGAVDWSQVPYVIMEPDDVERFKLVRGDIVFARSGATVGKSFLITDAPDNAVFASYLIRVRCNSALLLPRFAAYFFQSGDYWKQIADGSTGTGQPNFNGTKLAELQVPYTSLDEQHRTVQRVDVAFAWIERLASEATSARKLIDHLDQAILSKAFRGELVPQDPNDEPASMLLERIRAEQSSGDGKRRRKRSKAEAA